MVIEVDTLRLRDKGKDMLSQSNNYLENVKYIFDKIDDIDGDEKAWSGNSALRFKTVAGLDYRQYNQFGLYLRDYSNFLINSADSIESLCERVKLR